MAFGEILLSAVLQVVLEKLVSLGSDYAQRKFARPIFGVTIDQLNKWKKMLDIINAVLDDAEDKQLSGNHLVKLWMDDVGDLAYDIEDFLDEFEIQASQTKPEVEVEANTSGGLVKLITPFISQVKSSISNPNQHWLVSETKVKNINERLEEIIGRKAHLSLIENAVGRSDYTDKRLPSTSLSEPRFFGREKEEVELLEILTGEAKNGDTTLSIVPILGMGGVGKTTLAQRLYNHVRVSSYFESRAWVCVSDVFDALDITKTVLRSISGSSSMGKDLNTLQVELKDSLSRKKFLVVLDDVWNVNYGKWLDLLKPFEVGAKGSKIIITTRDERVVSCTGASSYPLKGLPLDNCTSLLAFHALGAIDFEMYPDLEKIGKKIAERCKGSPLAARVLGGLLRGKSNPEQWEAILNNKMWSFPIGENDEVLRVLKVSYVYLPSYLKTCFAYCAIFPKDFEIERDELVHLWIAEGFLDGRGAKENILELGQAYFDELVSRSFLQQSSASIFKFSMHDLLNDLATSIAGGTCFRFEKSQSTSNEDDAWLKKVRYGSFSSSVSITSNCMRAFHQMNVLRSLTFLPCRDYLNFRFHISNKVLSDLLTELKYLRVFSLSRCSIVEIPNCVGDLKHLRHLNFSYTSIERLPESIVGLCTLQDLILRGCGRLCMLPPGVTKMVSLRFLDIRETKSLKEMPLGMSKLKNLIILSKFVVGPKKGSRLKELRNMPHLRGELFISELQKVEEIKDAIDANLFGKQGLSKLFLCWDEDFGKPRNEKREGQILRYLEPYTNLKSLTISNYGGAIFPSWLNSASYSRIVSLCLWGCPNVTSLPSLGQLPSLRELSFKGLHAIRMIGSEFYGSERPFSSLTTLKFVEMLTWKDWSHRTGAQEEEFSFYCLEHLVIQSCLSLVGTLPCQLDRLVKLEIRSCPYLNFSTGEICLPSLRELFIMDCNKEILTSLVNLTSLTNLTIWNLRELVCFDYGFMSCLVKLKELRIEGCDKLTYLWQDGNEMRNLTCLQELVIRWCPQFTSFVVGEGEINNLPHNLERMVLEYCTSLEKLPSTMHALKYLRIEKCPKLVGRNIPHDDPSSSSNPPMSRLESLYIWQCESVTSVSFDTGRLAALKDFQLYMCKGVESLEEINVEPLEAVAIGHCENLRSLPQSLHTLSHLTRLSIRDCPGLEVEEFPPLPIILSSFYLENCPKVRSLPKEWHHLASLHHIEIGNCQGIECFPKGGFPPNLRQLHILKCEDVKQPVRDWGLRFLTSLQILWIDGISMGGGEGEKAWFPSEEEDDEEGDAWGLLFPSSLSFLWLTDMRKVERLSSGLRSHLSSLLCLGFCDCPMLRDLPEDGLPPSLRSLCISECPILKDCCSKLTGHYWPLIEDIPSVSIDSVQIQ